MGCSASRFEKEKTVTSRCRNREVSIKRCVQNQHAFAAAHAAYMCSLKNTGAALRQFGEGGDTRPDTHGHSLDLSLDIVADHDTKQLGHFHGTPYFPPPLPNFFTPSILSRTFTMPLGLNFSTPQALPIAKTLVFTSPRNSFTYTVDEGGDGDTKARKSHHVKPPPPLPPQLVTPPPAPPISKSSQWELYNVFGPPDHQSSAFGPDYLEHEDVGAKGLQTEVLGHDDEDVGTKGFIAEDQRHEDADVGADVEKVVSPHDPPETPEPSLTAKENNQLVSTQPTDAQITVLDFSRVLKELDDKFLLAYESGRDVSRLLEGQRTHYHSSFADSAVLGYMDHSSRVLRVMSWGRHTQFDSAPEEAALCCDDEKETHASTLDKLLAWEKKLYDEVKAGEVVRIKLERKSVQLKRQKKRVRSSTKLRKTRAVVKSLQTKYLVEVQAVDAASAEVEKLRDDCLHTQLVDLIQKSMIMWRAMLNCHHQQYQLIEDMQLVDSACAPSSTNEFHIKNTLQLESEIDIWRHNLEKLITTQKDYMYSVHQWLRLHLLEIESGGKGVPGSPEKMNSPPVYALCKAWLDALDRIQGSVPLHALKAFSHLIQELKLQQAEELKQKMKLDQLKKELEKKEQAFKAQELKYKKIHMLQSNSQEEREMDRNPLREKEVSLRLLREKVETEHEKYEHMCVKSGSMTLNSLQKGFPPVLSAMREFARTCSQRYTELFTLTIAGEKPVLQISY